MRFIDDQHRPSDPVFQVGVNAFLRKVAPAQSRVYREPYRRERGSLQSGTYAHTDTFWSDGWPRAQFPQHSSPMRYSIDQRVTQVGGKTVKYKHT